MKSCETLQNASYHEISWALRCHAWFQLISDMLLGQKMLRWRLCVNFVFGVCAWILRCLCGDVVFGLSVDFVWILCSV